MVWDDLMKLIRPFPFPIIHCRHVLSWALTKPPECYSGPLIGDLSPFSLPVIIIGFYNLIHSFMDTRYLKLMWKIKEFKL